MRKLASLILVFLAGFFPYMPILHAEKENSHIHCGTIKHSDQKEGQKHSMNSCIEIVKKIHKTTLSDFDTFEPIILIAPFEKYFFQKDYSRGEEHSIHFHTTDPPPREAPNRIGTIRIIS